MTHTLRLGHLQLVLRQHGQVWEALLLDHARWRAYSDYARDEVQEAVQRLAAQVAGCEELGEAVQAAYRGLLETAGAGGEKVTQTKEPW